MTVEQKREIERALNWFGKDCWKNEIVGIRITLDILGYWVFLTEKGYEIRKKRIRNDYKETKRRVGRRV